MSHPLGRITGPTLDVLEALLASDDLEAHGWAITKVTKLGGPTVYKILERLEGTGLVTARWEELAPEANRPRRRLYKLTPTGVVRAENVLAERRPEAFGGRFRPALGS